MNPNSDEENFLHYKKNINKKGIKKADIKDIFKLGYCYEFGKGTQQDIIKAFYYYNLSANRNHSKSQKNLGYCYEFGRGTEINLEQAFKWYKKSADNGFNSGQYSLALCYEFGKGTEINLEEAFKWYKKSADNGFNKAQNNLGNCYEFGRGTEINLEEAFKCYKKSSENNYNNGQYNLALSYEFGRGTEINLEEAFKWYKKSAESGCNIAQNNLGKCYELGKGTEINLEEAFKWYEMAEQNGYMVSKDKLDKLKIQIQSIHEDNNKKLLSNYINKLNNLVEIYKDDKPLMYKTKKFKIYNYNIGVLYHRLKQLENAYNYLEEAAYLKYSQAQKALEYFYKKEKDFLYNEKGISYDNINEIASTWYYLSKGIVNID